MLGQRQEIARLQSDFYRDSYRKILRWLFVTTVAILIMVSIIMYLILFQPLPQYYANTNDGKILPIVGTATD